MELYFVTILACLLHVMEHSCSVKLIDSYNVTEIIVHGTKCNKNHRNNVL